MRLVFYFCLVSLLLPLVFYAQEHTAIDDLLMEAKSKRYSQPEEAGKIATYIINQDKDPTITAQATLLLATSYYVRGNYNDAVINALQAKKIADASNAIEIKLKSNLFAIKLLRELGLETVATNYLEELHILEDNVTDKKLSMWLSGKLKQDRAYTYSITGNTSEATKLLYQAHQNFVTIKDTLSATGTTLLLSEVFEKTGRLDSAKVHLKKTLETLQQMDHTEMKALQQLAHIYFSEKNYSKSIQVFKEAFTISEQITNPYFKNKCVEGLAMNYLALEDAQNFYALKQQANILSTEMETDTDKAVNSVYNFINERQIERSEAKINEAKIWIYSLLGLFLLLLASGIIINYFYNSKTKQYAAISKYILPKEPVKVHKLEKIVLEKSAIVPEETERLLLKKLDAFESGKKYTNQDMSIAWLASEFETNTKYISEVINRHKGKNFNSYINELRIDYIIEKLRTDPVYLNYKISYLAEESGFSSHSSFTTVFKSVTGVSPTKFMEVFKKSKETA
ncbi:helix-turn-helix transcriptional regulator [Marixanthomonas spongiae]|uniref:HTH araC/xylS-type domain-containing protein n=1 Tax=Marixanthomonas spongiae TaxID=2174845 RepID=A0A2U0I5P7_9FLAO|nr:helix-turn-helix transcriptional regulator [Marixanthomonas spongiae]PVW16428.1 hypothetical protein DDV96_03990 [Marixanthomonas spongiae]